MDPQKEPGRVVVKECGDEEWPWYWHAFIGDTRVNGGLAHDYAEGMFHGQHAIAIWRKRDFYDNFYYDVETAKWIKKGELPPEPTVS